MIAIVFHLQLLGLLTTPMLPANPGQLGFPVVSVSWNWWSSWWLLESWQKEHPKVEAPNDLNHKKGGELSISKYHYHMFLGGTMNIVSFEQRHSSI